MQLVTDETTTRETTTAVPEVTQPDIVPDVLRYLDSQKITTSASVLGLADKIKPFISRALHEHEQLVEQLHNDAKEYTRRHARATQDAEQQRKYAKQYRELAKKYAKDAKDAAKRRPAEPDAQPIVDRLRKHKGVQFVRMSPGGKLMLYLKPTYTMAQVSEDSKERVRMFVGCFLVTIAPARAPEVRIINMTFGALGHWSVNSDGRPCWGEWQSIVNDLWGAGKLYEFVTMLVAYLSSNEDGSAYSKTYRFRDRRSECIQEINSQPARVGDTVLYIGEDTDNSDHTLKYTPGIVWQNNPTVRFVVPVHCGDYQGDGVRRDWHVRAHTLVVLTPEQVAELKTILDEVPEQYQRTVARAWGISLIEKRGNPERLRLQLLEHLDEAHSLDYATVAQPLVINYAKV
jgi:hypothetical protein